LPGPSGGTAPLLPNLFLHSLIRPVGARADLDVRHAGNHWVDTRVPFSQIHGHSSVTDWRRSAAQPMAGLHAVVTLDSHAKHHEIQLGNGRLIGIDPGHLATPTTPWRALELTEVASSP
jgi:hypothetical protein